MAEGEIDESTGQREGAFPEWGEAFLEALRTKTVADACRTVNIDRTTPYALRRRCPELRDRWAEITDARDDRIEDTLAERMVDGWMEPIFDKDGVQVAERRVYDNKTALAYLKARRPDQWSERRIDAGAGQEQQRIEVVFRDQPTTPPDTTKANPEQES